MIRVILCGLRTLGQHCSPGVGSQHALLSVLQTSNRSYALAIQPLYLEGETVKLLLKKRVDFIKTNNTGKTMHHLVMEGCGSSTEGMQALIDRGRELNNQDQQQGYFEAWLNKLDQSGPAAVF